MALYGDNLAEAIHAGTTWGQATDICGLMESALNGCYSSLSAWDNFIDHGTLDAVNRAIFEAISPSDGAQIKKDLDDTYASVAALDTLILEKIDEEGRDGALPSDYIEKLQKVIALGSQTVHLVDVQFHTSFAAAASDAIVPVVGGMGDKIANALSAFLGNFLARLWWVLILAIAGLWYWRKKAA